MTLRWMFFYANSFDYETLFFFSAFAILRGGDTSVGENRVTYHTNRKDEPLMAVYIGILSNRGKKLDNDASALAYAFDRCGIEPSDQWMDVDEEFQQMLLDWFFSGDWICRFDGEDDDFYD